MFVPKDEAVEVLAAITGAWAADLNYRVSRVKARLKFMIDDIGPEGMRERVEERLGRRLADFALPAPELASRDHLGVHAQKQPGLSYIGVPVHLGLISGDQMIAVADLAERAGADVRITRQQNFLVANVPDERVRRASSPSWRRSASRSTVNHVRGRSVGCTGEPHCNFSVTETKQRLGRLIEHLEARFGDADQLARPAARRLPARLRAALDRRPRLPGHDGARRRRQARAGLRHLRARRPRAGCADRQGVVPARPERGARRGGRRTHPGLARRPRRARTSRSPSSRAAQSDEELGLAAGLEPVKGRVREEAE